METPGEYTETLGLRSFTLRNFIEEMENTRPH